MKIIKNNKILSRMTACVLTAVMVLGLALVPARPVSAAATYHVQVTGTLMRNRIPKLLNLINDARKKAGAPTLQLDAKAMKIAERRAAQASLVFDHDTPAGKNPKKWSSIDGEPIYDGTWVNENLHFESAYKNVNIASHTFNGWFGSSSHRKSLLRDNVSRVGLAIYKSTGRSGLRSYTVVFVSMRETSKEKLIPYTDGFKKSVKTFPFPAASGNVKLMSGPETVKVSVGETVSEKPYYYQLSGTSKIPSGYCFKGECGTWKSSDEKVAVVAPDGTVTGMAAGKATITFSLNGKKAKSMSYTVKVRAAHKKI